MERCIDYEKGAYSVIVEDAVEQVKLRNNYYRDNYRKVVKVLLSMVLICISLIAVIIYQYHTRPEPRYFATTADGRITPISPVKVTGQ